MWGAVMVIAALSNGASVAGTDSVRGDPLESAAQRIFQRLLSTWDASRIPPQLVVTGSSRISARAVANGTIEVSIGALRFCLEDKNGNGEDRLAFLLAHEMAHQRDGHLWSESLRAAAFVPTKARAGKSGFLEPATRSWIEREADAQAVVTTLMAGFDPAAAVAVDGFLMQWVGAAYDTDCAAQRNDTNDACADVRDRTRLVVEHLTHTSEASKWFRLGLSAYFSGHYTRATKLFEQFGRALPSAAVHINLGMSQLAEGLELQARLSANGAYDHPMWIFPIGPVMDPLQNRSKRAHPNEPGLAGAERRMGVLFANAERAFEQALRMDSTSVVARLGLVSARLSRRNAQGAADALAAVEFGQPRWHLEQTLLRALIEAERGNHAQALRSLLALKSEVQTAGTRASVVRYLAASNAQVLLEHLNRAGEVVSVWDELAKTAQVQPDVLLFQMAVTQVKRLQGVPATWPRDAARVGRYWLGRSATELVTRVGVPHRILLNESGYVFVFVDKRAGVYSIADGMVVGALEGETMSGGENGALRTFAGAHE